MKNEKQKQKQLLEKIIKEIVDIEVNNFLYETKGLKSSPMYQIWIQPFANLANVIKAETQKTGARIRGTFQQGILGAGGTLLPFLEKVPFSGGKTWSQAIDESKNNIKKSIDEIDKTYAASYEAVRGAFASPDAAFILYSFNPGLYLGTALATGAIGSSLSAIGGILGRDLSSGYETWMRNNLGILRPMGTATYQDGISGGAGYDGGAGGYDGGYYQELEEVIQNLEQIYNKKYTSIYSSIKKNTKIPENYKQIFQRLLVDIARDQTKKTQEKLNTLNVLEKQINDFNPQIILKANGLPADSKALEATINNSDKGRAIVEKSKESLGKNPIQMQPTLPNSFEEWKKQNPQLANEFWSTYTKNNPELKDKKLESLTPEEKKSLDNEYTNLISKIKDPSSVSKQKKEFIDFFIRTGVAEEIANAAANISFPEERRKL